MKASMKSRLSDWDSAEFLEGRDAVIAYIEAAFEDGDPEIIKYALGLYKALKPDGDPKLSTFLGVLKALGMKMSAKAA
jgi:DNA-binding phage protein